MNYKSIAILILCILIMQCKNKKELVLAPINVVVDEIHGQRIEDPYRYMENIDDSIYINWLKGQKENKESVVGNISNRDNLKLKIEKFQERTPEKISKLTIMDNDVYFYLKENTTSKVKKLYSRDGFKGEEVLLYNPENFDNEHPYVINYIKPSWDTSKVVIGLTKNDEEFSILKILDVKTKNLVGDIKITNTLPTSLGGVKWLPDDSGIIYVNVPVIDSKSKKYLHNSEVVLYRFNDNPKESPTVIFSKKENPKLKIKEEDFPLIYLDNQNVEYIIGVVTRASRYRDTYYIKIDELNNKKIKWEPLFKKEEKIKRFIVTKDEIIYMTSKTTPNFQICKTSLSNPDFENPQVLVYENTKEVITDFVITKQGLFFVKIKNGVDAKLYKIENNQEKNIEIPKPSGSINVSSKNENSNDLWISIDGWTHKKETYKYDYDKSVFIPQNLYPVAEYSLLNDVVVKEIEVPSYDGTLVPLSVIYKNSIKLNGENRMLLTGYGAYGITDKPVLDDYLLNWINEGGIYALAHVRGGGEKGDAWHKEGFKTTKPNTWKDFISCTEYLIDKEYTSNKNLAVWSGSAGGILVGRAITERPDLYAAAIIRVGLLNTLRSEFAPNGKNNIKEFGTIKDSLEFKSLLEMDAFHNIKDGVEYPAVYLTGGMNDARVAVWQPSKFAAKLQKANASENPIILDIDFDGGHGFDATSNKKNNELADILSFALWQTGHPDYQLNR
ncbi:prolyl endopeptidase, S9 family [Formosa sp. Hel1_33_131]|uniref:prolyl oligopeptidase family serine peptidase n=1 Tax=Formosa sp. Hel1_33_131 TaxID=1336794 RepID=UPI000864EACB|nr:prolyl oligopeptidase family serine peptidase [Formosa sp. Hel1_33_131]AOR27391.1 prolyl endopeptidase, S9 family [Formosa sp. Hel1_33_131]